MENNKVIPLEILNAPKERERKPEPEPQAEKAKGRQVAVFKDIETEWSAKEQAWLYTIPDSKLVLYWDEGQGNFFPLAAKGSYLAKERVAVFGPDGTQLYRERIYLREPDGITPESLRKQRLLIMAKRQEYALRVWDTLIAFSWTVPAMLVTMVGVFLYMVLQAMSAYAGAAAAMLALALGELAYFGTWALGLLFGGLFLVALVPALARMAFRSRLFSSEEETGSGSGGDQSVNVIVNQGKTGGGTFGQSGHAQGYVNK